MKSDTFSNRLRLAMNTSGIKQIELANKTGIDKSLINKYLNGSNVAKQDNLTKLSDVLNVSEPWLMGYDEDDDEVQLDLLNQYKILFDKDNKLTEEQKKFFMDFLQERHKKIDEEKKD